MKRMISWKDLLMIGVSAFLLALSYEIFVFPNQFAPAGIPGIETMIQEKWGFPVSYMNLLINIPLIGFTYFFVNKEFAVKSGICSLLFSAFLYLFDHVDMSMFVYNTDNSAILAPIAGGVVGGFSYALVMKRNGSTGGTDVLAEIVHHYRPEQNMLWILFALNASVAVLSYFVYGYKIEPVILCLVYCFATSKVCDIMLKGLKEAVKFEIVTDSPEELGKALMAELGHGVTEIPAVGGFTHQSKTLLICLVNKRQIVQFQRILERFPGTFAYLHTVRETIGNFDRRR